jgi:hypothetical protein
MKMTINIQVVQSVHTGNVFVYEGSNPCSIGDQIAHGWMEIAMTEIEVDEVSRDVLETRYANAKAKHHATLSRISELESQISELRETTSKREPVGEE